MRASRGRSRRCATAARRGVRRPRTTSCAWCSREGVRVDLEALRRNLYASAAAASAARRRSRTRWPSRRRSTTPRASRPRSSTRCPSGCARAQAVFARDGRPARARRSSTPTGELLVVREDVGRHNAVDKVVGCALRARAAAARGPRAAGLGPHLVRDRAEGAGGAASRWWPPCRRRRRSRSSSPTRAGMTLVGFLRGARFNVYGARDAGAAARDRDGASAGRGATSARRSGGREPAGGLEAVASRARQCRARDGLRRSAARSRS